MDENDLEELLSLYTACIIAGWDGVLRPYQHLVLRPAPIEMDPSYLSCAPQSMRDTVAAYSVSQSLEAELHQPASCESICCSVLAVVRFISFTVPVSAGIHQKDTISYHQVAEPSLPSSTLPICGLDWCAGVAGSVRHSHVCRCVCACVCVFV